MSRRLQTGLTRRDLFRAALTAPLFGLAGCGHGSPPHPARSSTRPAPGLFHDAANAAGLGFVQGHGGREPLTILDTIGSGCAFLDFDGDGWLDILLVGQPSCALYRNRRDGTFENVTAQAGLDRKGHWLGCAVGDFDDDGYPDLYISGYDCGVLYHNTGRGTFVDVTEWAGIRPHGWETACGFLDADGDGKLDLYVGRYVEFGLDKPQLCPLNGTETACNPSWYSPAFSSLYLNGGSRFFEVPSALSGQSGKCLGAAFADFDGSGLAGIAVANDGMPGNLFKNRGRGHFEDIALAAGTAFNIRGVPQAGMGEDWADYNNDGRLDLVVNTYHAEPISLYTNLGGDAFRNDSLASGLGLATTPWVGFGVRFFDYDNDGLLDLLIANGHVDTGLAIADATQPFRQPLQLFRNTGGGRFEEIGAARGGPPFAGRYVGRGLAVGDYDNDGRLDALVIDSEGSALLLHNDAPAGAWIEMDLEGVQGPRNGEGAVVRLEAGTLRLMRNVTTSGSYLSANPSRVHFGLGSAQEARNIVIQWPGGREQPIPSLAAGEIWRIREDAAPSVRFATGAPGPRR